MKKRTGKAVANLKKPNRRKTLGRKPNPLRIDPTRTVTLRRHFIAQIRKRFAILKGRIVKLVAIDDVFGLKRLGHTANTAAPYPTTNKRWAFTTDAGKVEAFQEWLREQYATTLTDASSEALWDRFIREGFRKGAGRSFEDTSRLESLLPRADGADPLDFYAGTRDEFLRSAFNQPVAREKVELLAGRAFDEMEGVTDDMSLRMSRTLADGLTQGKSPLDIASDLTDELNISKGRAELIAKTEISRANSEGQLTALAALGVEELGVAVEWSNSGLPTVCPKCEALQGVVLKIEEAQGLLPLHPGCLCSWIPAGVGEDDSEQKSSKREIDSAMEDAGLDIEVSTSRPTSILNSATLLLPIDCVSHSPSDPSTFSQELLGLSSWLVANGSPDQPRDDHGRFAAAESAYKDVVAKIASGKLSKPERKVAEAEAQRLHAEKTKLSRLLGGTTPARGEVFSASTPAPSPPTAKPATPSHRGKESAHHVTEATAIHGESGNLASLVDVRRHLASKGVTDRHEQDAAITEARRQGKVSGSRIEGRHGSTAEERAAQHGEGEDAIGYLSLRGVANAEGNGWVTLESGQHVYIGEGGEIQPAGPMGAIVKGGKDSTPPDKSLTPTKAPKKSKVPKYVQERQANREEEERKYKEWKDKRDTVLTQAKQSILSSATSAGDVIAHGMPTREEMTGVHVGGVHFKWASGASTNAIDSIADIKAQIDSFPPKLVSAQSEVIFSSQGNVDDAHWEREYNLPGFKSAATGAGGKIVVYNGGRLYPNGFLHEAGHNFAEKVWGTNTPPLHSDYGKAQAAEKPVTGYGANSRAEDFAEACRMYGTKQGALGDISDHDKLKRDFPMKYIALKGLLE